MLYQLSYCPKRHGSLAINERATYQQMGGGARDFFSAGSASARSAAAPAPAAAARAAAPAESAAGRP